MGVSVTSPLLAFDDTDSPDGMCTTYLATLVIEALADYDLIGLPRLVRLNPNIPWKTRGNAAICLSFGHATGKGKVCGELDGTPLKYYERGRPAEPEDIIHRASKVVERAARFDCEKTNPGIVASNARPPQSLYWKTVREVVSLKEVESALKSSGAVLKKYKSGRGVIGASAAMSWRPRDRTWEVIAYRAPAKIGTPRRIYPKSVIAMDKSTRMTFNNYDYENGHIAIAPGSPCPVLFGIRGDSPRELMSAKDMIRGEPPHKWLMYMSNQGTEDHMVRRRVRDLRPGDSAKVSGTVSAPPATIPGGHVIGRLKDRAEIV